MAKAEAGKQSIDDLQKRYQKLNNQKVAAETELRSAQRALEQLQAEALEKYGTNDLEQLRAKLKKMQEDNERKRAEYQADLDKIETDLATVERNCEVAEAGNVEGTGK